MLRPRSQVPPRIAGHRDMVVSEVAWSGRRGGLRRWQVILDSAADGINQLRRARVRRIPDVDDKQPAGSWLGQPTLYVLGDVDGNPRLSTMPASRAEVAENHAMHPRTVPLPLTSKTSGMTCRALQLLASLSACHIHRQGRPAANCLEGYATGLREAQWLRAQQERDCWPTLHLGQNSRNSVSRMLHKRT